MDKLILFLVVNILNKYADAYLNIENESTMSNHAFDQQLYRDVLDPELCQEQISFIRNNTLLLGRFLDTGIRTPRGMLDGNFVDLGNYHKCLQINQAIPDSIVEGKYCQIHVPLEQEFQLPSFPELPDITWPEIPWTELNPETRRITNETFDKLTLYRRFQYRTHERTYETRRFFLNLAVCVPKACTTREAIDGLMFNSTAVGLAYDDVFCRLPNDKPWVAADYTAVVLFSFIGLITMISTAYDVHHKAVKKTDPKRINKILQVFSLYTNTRRLMTYTPTRGTIECMDGIRVIAMLWIIVGHTFLTYTQHPILNPIDIYDWVTSFSGLWINAAHLSVDTFFTLSGMLVVYTATGKLTRLKLFRNLHLFYLNRILRMFPILASFILMQASILHRVTDGPVWSSVVFETHNCRVFWWSTLLYVQNYVNPDRMCLPHSWYLAIDMQLHIISPLLLYWLLGSRRHAAWLALIGVMAAVLAATTTFNTIKEFPSTLLGGYSAEYSHLYYVNTLTRCPPFFVGMIYGYLMHVYRCKDLVIPKTIVVLLWLCAFTLSTTIFGAIYLINDFTWDNTTVDILYNSFARPAWAVALGWMVFACHQGYGGPINWFLSLHIWKVPSRISYAMYITHYTMIMMFNSTSVGLFYFRTENIMFYFYRDLVLTIVVSMILTLFVDSPFSSLIKMFLGGDSKKQDTPAVVNPPTEYVANPDLINDKTDNN